MVRSYQQGSGSPSVVDTEARDVCAEASEAKLKAAEAHHRQLRELSGDMVRVYTPEGVCVYASPSCKTLMGYEPEELLGQKGVALTHPDDVFRAASPTPWAGADADRCAGGAVSMAG